jgi:phosphonate transport system permease protein
VIEAVIPGTIATLVLGQMALALTGIVALGVYPLANSRLLGRVGHAAGRALLIVCRSTPEYVIAFILLQMFGPSMLPAVLALGLHNGAIIGYLVGRQADGLPLRADAPKGFNLYAYELTPRIYGQFLADLLYRWEIILRESAILGLLGVAALGYYVDAAIAELRFDVAVAIIVWVGLLTIAVDVISRRVRAALRLTTLPQHT